MHSTCLAFFMAVTLLSLSMVTATTYGYHGGRTYRPILYAPYGQGYGLGYGGYGRHSGYGGGYRGYGGRVGLYRRNFDDASLYQDQPTEEDGALPNEEDYPVEPLQQERVYQENTNHQLPTEASGDQEPAQQQPQEQVQSV